MARMLQAQRQLPSREFMAGSWDMMVQGIAFAQFDDQGGPRGATQFGSLNWGMLMATHSVAGGALQLRGMFSLDALGVTGAGYPLLLQSGEEYQGALIHDRQHPHDAFMELGAQYARSISKSLTVSLYAAPVGEPALGPVAYIMRPSAMDNPEAPIGHHWQDATHVSFGVLSASVATARWKAEGSWFNGREPDDQRWNFDPIRLDSWSGRLTFAPDQQWSASASFGFLKSPDSSEPTIWVHRAGASLSRGMKVDGGGQWSTTLVWGGNLRSDESSMSNSGLLESEISLDNRNTFFGRVERVQKSARELALTDAPFAAQPSRRFSVSEYSLGYVRGFARAMEGRHARPRRSRNGQRRSRVAARRVRWYDAAWRDVVPPSETTGVGRNVHGRDGADVTAPSTHYRDLANVANLALVYIMMRMRRLTLVSRILISAIAIVQMAAPVLAVVADARLIADSGGAPQVHVEDHTQKSCRPVHPDDCALCQLLTHLSAPRATPPAIPTLAAARCAVRDDSSLRPASIARAQQRSRAPPVSLS